MRSLSVFMIFLALYLSLPAALGAEKRGRVLDFDDQLVEGMNKKPLDSLQQLTDGRRGRQRSHLYRKRAAFRMETRESLNEVRMVQ